jgi:hypothetical protein
MSVDADKQLAWEARHRPRAAAAALLGALGLLVFYVTQQLLQRDLPKASGLETLQRVAERGRVETLPSLQAPFFDYMDTKSGLIVLIGLGGLLGFLGVAYSVGFLGVLTRARQAGLRRFIVYLPIVGGVLYGISVLASQLGTLSVVSTFLDSDRTVQDARDANASGVLVFANVLGLLGTFSLAVGIVLVALNAMRVGLLTRMLGYLGVASGALMVIFPLPIVQIFWLGALGVLLLGRWPGGELPAWRTGNAEPWPTPERAQRTRPDPQPAPEPVTTPAPARRKRKKRH